MARKPLFKIDPGSEVKASGSGYIYVTTTPDHPGKKMADHKKVYVYKHVALMELSLGRFLRPDEEVHHKNLDDTDNSPSNLELKKKGKHQRDHALTDNPFWKHSPRTKPGVKRASILRVVSRFLNF
jgi:hypothetical protein